MWFIQELCCHFLILQRGYRSNGARGFALSQPFLIGSWQEINLWKWFPQPLGKLYLLSILVNKFLKTISEEKAAITHDLIMFSKGNSSEGENFLHRVELSGTTSPTSRRHGEEGWSSSSAFWSAAFIRGIADDETCRSLHYRRCWSFFKIPSTHHLRFWGTDMKAVCFLLVMVWLASISALV